VFYCEPDAQLVRAATGKEIPSLLGKAHEDVSCCIAQLYEKLTGIQSASKSQSYSPEIDKKRNNLEKRWFKFLMHCIPKSISEPWHGDMCEMRETMRLEGYSQRAITLATISQFALLLINWGIYKALDVLMPFKKSKID
jgi:hypothetical protein